MDQGNIPKATFMNNFVVIGAGIVGLSVAEYLSRKGKVLVLHSPLKHPASHAAAANLSIKAQRYARDPHYELKIRGHGEYENWLKHLTRMQIRPIDNFFKKARGVDTFESEEDCIFQWDRVLQPGSELVKRKLPPQELSIVNSKNIEYAGEACVNANALLEILRIRCLQQGVVIEQGEVESKAAIKYKFFNHFKDKAQHIILCAGAWTPNILQKWEIENIPTHKYRYGSTWILPNDFETGKYLKTLSLLEFVETDRKHKFTLSNPSGKELFLSSSSHAADSLGDTERFATEDAAYLDRCAKLLNRMVRQELPEPVETLSGMRLRFGHKELWCEKLQEDLTVCAGAHKSGFILAPVLGEHVRSVIDSPLPSV